MTWRMKAAILMSALLTLGQVPAAMAQPEDDDMVQMRPNPEDVVSMISSNTIAITYVPLEDVARALGSGLEYDEAGHRYSARSTAEGVLELKGSSRGMERCCAGDPPPERASQAGVDDDDVRIAPGAERRGIRSAQVLRGAQQTVTTPISQAESFAIDDYVVSKGIIIINGQPFMPLGDLNATMGIVVEERPAPDGGTGLVWEEGAAPLIGLSERGIIIINSQSLSEKGPLPSCPQCFNPQPEPPGSPQSNPTDDLQPEPADAVAPGSSR